MLPRVVVFACVALAALAQSADRDARLVQTAQGPVAYMASRILYVPRGETSTALRKAYRTRLSSGDVQNTGSHIRGPVRGYRTADGELFAFHSIPYATAPTGRDRFKAPLPGPLWLTPFEAVEKNIICPQANLFNLVVDYKNMQENCLIANVYVPDTQETNLPVVVYVHGGAYQMGSGNLVTPTHLVRSKRLIAVTFNYRLGVHGFLCLGTAGAPGNAGMKDQVALLRWVNKNIASFGGNPNDVTIAGYSAGSSAVDLLQLSKITKGLFNKVIPESGANVGVWSVQIDPLENAKYFARKLNFTKVDNVYALEEYFRTISFQSLQSNSFEDRTDSSFVFSPCVERDTGEERFLEDTPVNILKESKYNKLPMLYGFANMEGLSQVHVGTFDKFKNRMSEKFSEFLPADLQFESDAQRAEVAEEIKRFYFGDKAVGEETVEGFIDYFTDVMFAYPTLRSVKLQVEAGNDMIYLYEYSFTDKGIPSAFPARFDVDGADHCAQSSAVLDGVLMKMDTDETTLPERFRIMKSVVRELWINFITTGEPVPAGSALTSWPPAGADRAPHMSLNLPLELRGALLRERTRLWDSVYERHYRMPIPPPTPPSSNQPHYEL